MFQARQVAVAELLLGHGAAINARDALGRTVLHKLARYDTNTELASYLIERGADIDVVDETGEKPLDVAQQNKQEKMIALLSRSNPVGGGSR